MVQALSAAGYHREAVIVRLIRDAIAAFQDRHIPRAVRMAHLEALRDFLINLIDSCFAFEVGFGAKVQGVTKHNIEAWLCIVDGRLALLKMLDDTAPDLVLNDRVLTNDAIETYHSLLHWLLGTHATAASVATSHAALLRLNDAQTDAKLGFELNRGGTTRVGDSRDWVMEDEEARARKSEKLAENAKRRMRKKVLARTFAQQRAKGLGALLRVSSPCYL